MKSNLEMRQEAKAAMSSENRAWRIFGATLLFGLVSGLATGTVQAITQAASGWAAKGLEFLVSILFNSLGSFGAAAIALWAIQREPDGAPRRWTGAVSAMFSGFADPFGCMWLFVTISIFTIFWMLLVAIPGFLLLYLVALTGNAEVLGAFVFVFIFALAIVQVVCLYRYRMAFFFKANNPSLPASACIKNCMQKMKNRKWWLFCFDCSYWREFLVPVLLALIPVVLMLALKDSAIALGLLISLPLYILAMVFLVRATIQWMIGQGVFFRELLQEGIEPEQTN